MEYDLLMCSQITIAYLYDMYFLYEGSGRNGGEGSKICVDTITALKVPRMIDPDEWLISNCVKCVRWKRDEENQSLEIYVARPMNSGMFYAIGEEGTYFMSRKNPNDAIRLDKDTVEVLMRKSILYCNGPNIFKVDWNKSFHPRMN
ncbi:hypothetical protein AVEN_250091-1 [Araneus ventricosus]|uniref:Uncharacterized protein n=1 Tax=Araneus ventricosus TaxID=182803 RepID=A0A4Y2VD95_ARAVE|nr:hypothetical protein AVEN_250091-1 [Araneus ventricosus]